LALRRGRIALDGRGLPVHCAVVTDPPPAALRPQRSDLIESTFTAGKEN